MNRPSAIMTLPVRSVSIKKALMRNGGRTIISKLNLIRKPYRTLLNGGQGYASFDVVTVSNLIDQLDKTAILDPMSGYGSLLEICSRKGIPSVSVEINAPLYLWHLIRWADLYDDFVGAIDLLLMRSKNWPKTITRAQASDQWFTETALNLLDDLMQMNCEAVETKRTSHEIKTEIIAAALMVPFCGRLSCCTESDNNPIWVKKGGIVVYDKWERDYEEYLISLRSLLVKNSNAAIRGTTHKIILGDCRLIDFRNMQVRAMITSPPYPNHSDYFKMFEPELCYCSHLNISNLNVAPATQYIGSTKVKGTTQKQYPLKVAGDFLDYVPTASVKSKKKAIADATYHYPNYANYFNGLYDAYCNVSRAAAPGFRGFIIVRNNHFRGREIPVAQTVIEIWQNFGFTANIINQIEVFHTGTKNPRAKGTKAKQLEFTIEISK
jgi:hypothetical protein